MGVFFGVKKESQVKISGAVGEWFEDGIDTESVYPDVKKGLFASVDRLVTTRLEKEKAAGESSVRCNS